MKSPDHRFERALIGLVVLSVCVSSLGHELPHLVPSLVVLGVVVAILRFVFWKTRGW